MVKRVREMAQAIVFDSGSPFVGNPIVYKVTANTVSGASFHRVVLRVKAALQGAGDQDDTGWTPFTFSSPVESGGSVLFDISSALRAVGEKYQYDAVFPSKYPYIGFSLKAWDEYMIDGVIYENVGIATNDGGRTLMGGYSEIIRSLLPAETSISSFSGKPTSSPEIVMVGDEIVYANTITTPYTINNITRGATPLMYKPTSVGMKELAGNKFYVIPRKNKERYAVRFINGYGCMETYFLNAPVSKKYSAKTVSYAKTSSAIFNKPSRSFSIKDSNDEEWSFSSGPLDENWQAWFFHEFLMAKWSWIQVNGDWLPCNLIPDETTVVSDKTKNSLLEIPFYVQFCNLGSPNRYR